MKQVMVSGGAVKLEEVPAPLVEPGTVLVKTNHSCISIGTEMSGVRSSGASLWKRALRQPQHVRKVVDMVLSEGWAYTHRLVQERLSIEQPTGYSLSGVVVAVGAGVEDCAIGDRVACAGSQCAFHAEVVCIPRNLMVHIPEGVAFEEASSVALGAIAMQGVRRASPTLGETFVVIGLGVLGQLTAQILKANGCRVIGIDLDRDRLALAQKHGMNWGVHPDDGSDIQSVALLSGGVGVDGVIITAASPSDAIVSTAFQMCRKKARVVLVGDVGLNLQRADFYVKELDFLISTSYGPGRYDKNYEEDGLDYPVEQVRWTENRNMGEYLRLVAEGAVAIKPMIAAVHDIDNVALAYGSLQSNVDKPLMVLLSYSPNNADHIQHMHWLGSSKNVTSKKIRIALIGAGAFAKGMHLPNLVELKSEFVLRAVVSRTGHNAAATAKRFDADYCTTDYKEVLADKDIDAVIITTRHDKHGSMALEALRAGKHVLLEKPLALQEHELLALEAFFADGCDPKPVLLTGFNRRFSPYSVVIAEQLKRRSNPMMINYRMNAGYIPLDHWVHGAEGGGRNRGEACHIYDLFTFLTGSKFKTVQVSAISPQSGYFSANDNFAVNVCFDDGSLATLTYTAMGAKEFPKESMDIFVDGKVISLDDYRHMTTAGFMQKRLATRTSEKGQLQGLVAFAAAVKGIAPWPIPLWQQMQATRISYEVDLLLKQRV